MPQRLKPSHPRPCSSTREATAVRSPWTPTRVAHAQQRRPSAAEDEYIIFLSHQNEKDAGQWQENLSITGVPEEEGKMQRKS